MNDTVGAPTYELSTALPEQHGHVGVTTYELPAGIWHLGWPGYTVNVRADELEITCQGGAVLLLTGRVVLALHHRDWVLQVHELDPQDQAPDGPHPSSCPACGSLYPERRLGRCQNDWHTTWSRP